LLTAPTNPTAVITWVADFITDYLTPQLASYATYVAQLAALETEIAAVLAAIESAQAKFASCSITVPSLPTITIPGVPSPPTFPPFGGSGSITGSATTASPIELENDQANPGDNKVYGTNSSGVKGWYDAGGGGGGSLELTDGTHDVTGVTKITVTGATVGGTSPDATLTITGGGGGVTEITSTGGTISITDPTGPDVNIDLPASGVTAGSYTSANITVDAEGRVTAAANGGGGSTPVPGTISDLAYWYQADQNANQTAGFQVPVLPNSSPSAPGYNAVLQYNGGTATSGAKRSATTLNSLPILSCDGTSDVQYEMVGQGMSLVNQATFVALFQIASDSGYLTLVSGTGLYSLQFRVNYGHIDLVSAGHAEIVVSGTNLTPGTWYQASGTYNVVTGAYQIRIAKATTDTGSSAQTINAVSDSILWSARDGGQNFNGYVAELMVYTRVLTLSEIESIEAYLTSKWGV